MKPFHEGRRVGPGDMLSYSFLNGGGGGGAWCPFFPPYPRSDLYFHIHINTTKTKHVLKLINTFIVNLH